MKKTLQSFCVYVSAAVVAILLLLSCSPAQMMRLSPEERANRLKDSLLLTKEQTAKVELIYKENQIAMQALFDSSAGNRESLRPAMQKQAQKTDSKIEAILTDTQKQKYEEMKKNRPMHGWGR